MSKLIPILMIFYLTVGLLHSDIKGQTPSMPTPSPTPSCRQKDAKCDDAPNSCCQPLTCELGFCKSVSTPTPTPAPAPSSTPGIGLNSSDGCSYIIQPGSPDNGKCDFKDAICEKYQGTTLVFQGICTTLFEHGGYICKCVGSSPTPGPTPGCGNGILEIFDIGGVIFKEECDPPGSLPSAGAVQCKKKGFGDQARCEKDCTCSGTF